MALDPKFNKFSTTSPVLMNFDYADILSGTGIIDFYLAVGVYGGSSKHLIVQNVVSSASTQEDQSVVGSVFELSPFNRSQTIRGTITFQCYIASTNPVPTITLLFQKDSGGVKTTVGTTTLLAFDSAKGFLGQIEITEGINFKKGDFLCLTISKSNAAATYIGTDPTNLVGTHLAAGQTKTTLSIPFDLPNQ